MEGASLTMSSDDDMKSWCHVIGMSGDHTSHLTWFRVDTDNKVVELKFEHDLKKVNDGHGLDTILCLGSAETRV